jgi:hypothetical protein
MLLLGGPTSDIEGRHRETCFRISGRSRDDRRDVPAAVMSRRSAGVAENLVVDLRGRRLETLDDFWDAVAGPCGLPDWFGRTIAAWSDTIQTRGISDVIDRHDTLIIHVDRAGFLARDNRELRAFRRTFAGRRTRLIVEDPRTAPGS